MLYSENCKAIGLFQPREISELCIIFSRIHVILLILAPTTRFMENRSCPLSTQERKQKRLGTLFFQIPFYQFQDFLFKSFFTEFLGIFKASLPYCFSTPII